MVGAHHLERGVDDGALVERRGGSGDGTGNRGRFVTGRGSRRRARWDGSSWPGPGTGTTDKSASVYGWRGDVSTSVVGPISTTRPRYITATRWL